MNYKTAKRLYIVREWANTTKGERIITSTLTGLTATAITLFALLTIGTTI